MPSPESATSRSSPPRSPADGEEVNTYTPLSQVLMLYQEHIDVTAKRGTRKNVRTHIGHIEAALGADSAADELTQHDVRKLIQARRAKGAADISINGTLIVLRAALRRAVEEELLDELPCKVKKLRVGARIPSVFERGELDRLIAATYAPWLRAVFIIAAEAGLRHLEILYLDRADVDLHAMNGRGVVYVRAKPAEGWEPKSYHERRVPMSKRLREELEVYLLTLPPGQHRLFPRRTRWADREVRATFIAAGLYDENRKPGLHALRRTWATRNLEKGVSLRQIMTWAGWADVATAQRYLGMTADGEERAAQLLDA